MIRCGQTLDFFLPEFQIVPEANPRIQLIQIRLCRFEKV
jgi:hypothetical protein